MKKQVDYIAEIKNYNSEGSSIYGVELYPDLGWKKNPLIMNLNHVIYRVGDHFVITRCLEPICIEHDRKEAEKRAYNLAKKFAQDQKKAGYIVRDSTKYKILKAKTCQR